MKSVLYLVVTTIIIAACESPVEKQPDPQPIRDLTAAEKQIVEAGQDFSFKLFQKVNESDPLNNVFISPLSVSMAFGMALNGANGQTYSDMRSTLGFESLDNNAINTSYQSLIDLLHSADDQVKFEIANSIWYEKTFAVEQLFLQTNQNYFDAEVAGMDFSDPATVDVINNWISEKTNNKINKMISQLSRETVLALINAIYFKASWKYEFDPDETTDDQFTTYANEQVACKMMQLGGEFNYYRDDDVQILDLPYGNSNFSMTILQPAYGKDINQFISTLDNSRWQSYLSQMEPDSGNLQMPKFKLSYKSASEALILNSILSDLGMGIAFSPSSADFSRINPLIQIFISLVLHKTFIQVDEEGTEAAAATVILFERTTAGENTKFFMRLDRPFVFVIRETNTKAILFTGKLNEPVWQE